MTLVRPRLLRGTLALLAALAFTACDGPSSVAVGAALSGSFVNATRLAIEDAVAAGGLPDLDTLLLHESTNAAAPAIGMAEQFIALPGIVAVIGHSNSSASLAASPIYNAAQVVQIAPTSTASRYAEAGPYSFRLAPPDARQGEVIAAAIHDQMAVGGRVGILYVNDDYGRGLRAAVLANLDTTLHRVVLDRPHNDESLSAPPAADLARRVTELARALQVARPQVLLLLARFSTTEWYLPAIREALPGAILIGGDAIGPAHFRADQQSAWVGVQYVDFLDFSRSESLRGFRDRFQATFGTPARSAEILSYDAMRLILAGIADGARTGPALRDWLLSLGTTRPAFDGLSGPIQFEADGEVTRPYVLVTIPPAP